MPAMQFNEQNGYGIINARIWYGDGGFDQANDWQDGDWLDYTPCPVGEVIAGFGGYVQGDYGLVNVCRICRPPPQECPVVSQTIVAMECVETGANGVCVGHPDESDPVEAFSVTTDCDACDTNGTMKCSNAFNYQRANTETTESSEIQSMSNEIDIGISVTMHEGFETFVSSDQTLSFDYKHTWGSSWENSQTQSLSTQSSLSADCDITLPPRSKAVLSGTVLERNLVADMRLTLLTVTACGATNSTHPGTVTISNVPISTMVTNCKVNDVQCDPGALSV